MSSKPFQRWQVVSPTRLSAVDPRLEQALEQARETGHAQGYAAGLAQGLADGRQGAADVLAGEAAQLATLLDNLAQPLATLEQELLDSLLQLASALPPAARQISVHLHPLDLDLVRGISPRGRNDARWELVADAGLSRGGCRISTESSQVDLTLEARLSEVFARLMDGGP